MTSKREQILEALLALLQPLALDLDPAPKVQRNGELPQVVGPEGLVVLRDGNGEIDEYVIGAPEPYTWAYAPTIEVLVQDKSAELRDPQFDRIVAAIGAAVATDRTLGGLCDWCEVALPDASEVSIANAPGVKGGQIAVAISYSSSNPTG